MKSIAAFLRLIRGLNLLFILLTQCLFYYIVLPFVYATNGSGQKPYLSQMDFLLMVAASICIAAAGYIINDYFDLNIDLVNKPDKLIIEKHIKRRWAIVFHVFLSMAGLVLSCYVGWHIHNLYIPVFNLLCIAALWFYSTTFKQKILVGNVIISLLTAWVILVITIAEYNFIRGVASQSLPGSRLLKVSFIYAGFAFVISLVREVVKDMEDMDGDAKYGCRTMPITWGIPASKVFAGVWLVVVIADVVIIQFYALHLGWWLSSFYSFALIVFPLIVITKKLYEAQTGLHFHIISRIIKFVMLTGIISMVFFRLYM
ncbi:MAG: geranylgeranylglycerol-phosphate geranylgeranyltransferase [Ginsengibacter sp.]